MSYAAISDMTARFNATELIKITDRADSGSRNDAVLQLALNGASSYMDGYFQKRYVVIPIVATITVPYSIQMVEYCCDLTRWYLYLGDRPDQVEARKGMVDAWLMNIAKGIMGLGMINEPATLMAPQNINPITSGNAPNRVFTSDRLTGY